MGRSEVVQSYAAVIKQAGLPWWIGGIEEAPGVVGTRGELLEPLRITLEEALELKGREAREAAASR